MEYTTSMPRVSAGRAGGSGRRHVSLDFNVENKPESISLVANIDMSAVRLGAVNLVPNSIGECAKYGRLQRTQRVYVCWPLAAAFKAANNVKRGDNTRECLAKHLVGAAKGGCRRMVEGGRAEGRVDVVYSSDAQRHAL